MNINNFEQAFIIAKRKENERNTRFATENLFKNNLVNEVKFRDRYTGNILGTNSINFEHVFFCQGRVKENDRSNWLDNELKINNHN